MTTRNSVPLELRSREDERAFLLKRRVFYVGRWTFAQRSRSVVGERLDQSQLSPCRAKIGSQLMSPLALRRGVSRITRMLSCSPRTSAAL